eukprot:4066359-Pyramimonas_sp.AAC.1
MPKVFTELRKWGAHYTTQEVDGQWLCRLAGLNIGERVVEETRCWAPPVARPEGRPKTFEELRSYPASYVESSPEERRGTDTPHPAAPPAEEEE